MIELDPPNRTLTIDRTITPPTLGIDCVFRRPEMIMWGIPESYRLREGFTIIRFRKMIAIETDTEPFDDLSAEEVGVLLGMMTNA